MAVSEDQLDQSRDSKERKEGGYNLKNMFGEVRQLSEGANGVAANMGKPKKSLTIFGLRRGSDPLGLKVKEGMRREAGGAMFLLQKPPVVLEEPLNAENVDPEQDKKPAVSIVPASVNSPSGQSKKLDHHSSSGPQKESKTATESPTSLPVLPETRVNVDGKVLKTEVAPQQTSTPISPLPVSILDSTSTNHSEKGSVTPQNHSDLCWSPDQVGSSPHSSFPNKTLSSASSIKMPTSSLAESPSPKSVSRSMGSDKDDQSSSFTNPPDPALNSEHAMLVTSATKGDIGSFPVKKQKPETYATLKTDVKTEINRAGIVKNSSTDGSESSGPSSPSDQGLKSLPLNPCSQLSPSSPKGSRISSVAIIKASPDSKREFSVVTLLDEEEPSYLSKDQNKESAGRDADIHPAVSQRGDVSVSGGPASGDKVRPALCPEKDDLMEMDDIKDCKVTHVGGAKNMDEKGEEIQKKNRQVKSPKDEKLDLEEKNTD